MAQITPTLNIPSPFFAVSKTGEYWTPRPDVNRQYLAVSDTGTLLEITYNKGDGFFVKELSGYTITSSPPATLKDPDPVKSNAVNKDNETEFNAYLSKRRVKIEHLFATIKRFKSLYCGFWYGQV